jgi:hypothetical protein
MSICLGRRFIRKGSYFSMLHGIEKSVLEKFWCRSTCIRRRRIERRTTTRRLKRFLLSPVRKLINRIKSWLRKPTQGSAMERESPETDVRVAASPQEKPALAPRVTGQTDEGALPVNEKVFEHSIIDLTTGDCPKDGVWGATEQKTGLRNDRYSSSGASGLRRGRN